MISTDILVVGLGPAGAAAAAAAAAAGYRVLAIERKQRIGEPVQCAEFIPLPISRYAQRAGVTCQAIEGMHSVLPSGFIQETRLSGLMVDRARFDRALADQARDAGAQLQTATRLKTLDIDRSAAIIESTAGVSVVNFRAVVAADGPRSTVAQAIGMAAFAEVVTRQYTVPLCAPYGYTDIWLSDEYPGGYAWLFPKGRVANIGLGVERRHVRELKPRLDEFHARLRQDGLVADTVLARTGGPIPVGGLRERLVVGNVVFVGDAAGLTHPITGGGIAAAVTSGEQAGEAVASFLQTGDIGALSHYEYDIRECYGPSQRRGTQRRHDLAVSMAEPVLDRDSVQRRGWIAFPEYYA